jgi:ABC-2 type transport system ATP-binding protein
MTGGGLCGPRVFFVVLWRKVDRSFMSASIDVRDLCKTYVHGTLRRRRFEALRGVTLQVYPGEVFGLLGPNGAGKTTLIKILLGIIRKSSGQAFMLGQTAGSASSRQRVGYLPENLRVASHHTGRMALEFYGHLSGLSGSQLQRRCDEVLELVGLTGRDRELARGYSKGMGQRLGLAQALLHDPDLLILDEPTDGLDPLGRNQVRAVLAQLKDAGKTIFLNSHILQEVESICDRVAILARGQLQGVGSVKELASRLKLQLRMHIEVAPEQLAAAQSLLQAAGAAAQPVGPDRLTVAVSGQAEVDRLIDALRGGHVSLQKLLVDHGSLEEVFISMVHQPTGPSALPVAG